MRMRMIVLGLMAALALAACGKPEEKAPPPPAPPAAFPNLFQTSYRAEATMTDSHGQTTEVVTIRDGQKMRMEFSGGGARTIISNPETGEVFVVMDQGGAPMAMRIAGLDMPDAATGWQNQYGGTAVRGGPCSAAGETGFEWATSDGNTSCVTGDGIFLRAAEAGRTTWETTSVQRGPQSAALFAPPAGVRIMDMSGMRGAAQEALDNMGKSGK
jgi:hypothetical protein